MEDAYLGGFLHALEKAIFLVLAAAKRVFVFVIVRTVGDAQTVADGFLVIVCRWAGWEKSCNCWNLSLTE